MYMYILGLYGTYTYIKVTRVHNMHQWHWYCLYFHNVIVVLNYIICIWKNRACVFCLIHWIFVDWTNLHSYNRTVQSECASNWNTAMCVFPHATKIGSQLSTESYGDDEQHFSRHCVLSATRKSACYTQNKQICLSSFENEYHSSPATKNIIHVTGKFIFSHPYPHCLPQSIRSNRPSWE